jgi:small subunit ribosomal protein S14
LVCPSVRNPLRSQTNRKQLKYLLLWLKKSVIHRNKKREKLVAKYAAKRASLKKILSDPETSEEDFINRPGKITKLPKNSSPVRLFNRCTLTGRPRATIRQVWLSRISFRELPYKEKSLALSKPLGKHLTLLNYVSTRYNW